MKLVLGKTPEQIESEEAEAIREEEARIQQAQVERQIKLEALHKKQKQTKIAIITITSAVAAILLVFGTYNTFFKKGISLEEDVKPEIEASINALNFPSDSIGNYLHDNCDALINRYMSYDEKNKTIKSIFVNKDSCYISKVKKLNASLAQVYFAVNITVNENDTEVTDPIIIDQLKKNGFNTNISSSTPDSSNIDSSNIDSSKIDSSKIDSSAVDSSSITDSNSSTTDSSKQNSSEISSNKDDSSTESKPSTTTASTAKDTDSHQNESSKKDDSSHKTANEEDYDSNNDEDDENEDEDESNIVSSSYDLNYKTDNDQEEHYYISSNGKIMKVGKSTTKRYNFYLPIELYVNTDDAGNAITAGFRPAGEMNLYSLETVDQTNFKEITVYDALDCDEETLKDEETIQKVTIKIDKTLQDLYEGRDTSQDFLNYYKFNTYDARYDGINSVKVYNTTNALGFNTHVRYTITTSQGFQYTADTWMLVEPSGNSYIIKGML